MKVFITGGQGFVGRHLASHLASLGHEVVAAGREVDVTNDEQVRAAIQAATPDAIVHLAAQSSVAASLRDPVTTTKVNVVGTAHVLDAARDLAPAATVLVVSSSEVYGAPDSSALPVHEHARCAPLSPYATSKLEAEHLAREAHLRGQRVVTVRPFTHLGPGQAPTFVVPALVARLRQARASGAPSVAVGNLAARRDLTDVRDVVRAYELLLRFGHSGEIYNVASGHETALLEVAEQLRNALAPEVTFTTDPALLRPLDVPVIYGDATKLHEATGWEPRLTLDATLADLLAAGA